MLEGTLGASVYNKGDLREAKFDQLQIRHILWEANQLADYVANMAINQSQGLQFNNF